MTLGARPEWLVLGYLRNQRLVRSVDEIESITVDWEVGAAAVKTRSGIKRLKERTARRTVTTGCGQGSVFGGLMDEIEAVRLPEASITQAQLYGILNAIRLQESTYKSAGSVHGCALFKGEEMLLFIEDVGRHNAIDTIAAGCGCRNPRSRLPTRCIYTTGRLTSEMIIKSGANGLSHRGSRAAASHRWATRSRSGGRLDLCAIGRATNKHFPVLHRAAPAASCSPIWPVPNLRRDRLKRLSVAGLTRNPCSGLGSRCMDAGSSPA
jgi:FdhD protein